MEVYIDALDDIVDAERFSSEFFTSMPESAVSITHLAPSLIVEPCDAIDVEQQGVVCEPGGNNRGA